MMTASERVPHSAPRLLASHPRLVDLSITIFAVVLPTIAFAVHGPRGHDGLQVADVVSVVVFVPLVLLRGRWPVPIMAAGVFSAAAITLVSAERTVALPAAFVLLFTVAARTNRSTTLRAGGSAATVLFLAAAAQNGLTLYELVPQQSSLEEIFMELTHDSVEYRAGAHHGATEQANTQQKGVAA
jgi:hypothetical protein